MRTLGPKCEKCHCGVHKQDGDNFLKCENCGHRWRVLSTKELSEMRDMVEQLMLRADWKIDDEL